VANALQLLSLVISEPGPLEEAFGVAITAYLGSSAPAELLSLGADTARLTAGQPFEMAISAPLAGLARAMRRRWSSLARGSSFSALVLPSGKFGASGNPDRQTLVATEPNKGYGDEGERTGSEGSRVCPSSRTRMSSLGYSSVCSGRFGSGTAPDIE
jgi:hypothetical protein